MRNIRKLRIIVVLRSVESADYKKYPSHLGEGALGASFPFWNWLEMLQELRHD